MFPTAMVVKVKDAETKRNKASVAHTGWKKRTKTSTTTPKKVCLYSSSLQLLFQQKVCKSASDRAAGKPHTPCDWASCVKEKRVDEKALLQSFSPLSRSYHVSFSLSFPSSPAYCRYFCSWLSPVSLLRSLLSLFLQLQKQLQAGYSNTNGLFLVLSYALHLICSRVVLASFTLTTMAVGNTSEGFAFVLSPWSI